MVNYFEIIDNFDCENVKFFVRKVKSSVFLGKIFLFLIIFVRKEKEKCLWYIIFCMFIKICGEFFFMFRMELKDDIQYFYMYYFKILDFVKEIIKFEMNNLNGKLCIFIVISVVGMGVNFLNLN